MNTSGKNPWEDNLVIKHCENIAECYKYWTGKNLFDSNISSQDLATKMYHAPIVIVSHGIEEDPVFNHGNKKAQELW